MQNVMRENSDTFTAMFSHDLKTPINAGILALETLLKTSMETFSDLQKEILHDILSSTKLMKQMTDNFLTKYKCENTDFTLAKEKISLEKIVRGCVEEVKYIFEERGQTISVDCAGDTTAMLDKIEISRVLYNLLVNASEHSPRGGRISAVIDGRGNQLSCSVIDCGQGIPLANPNEIFQKDFTLAKKEKRLGTGLGLYISKLITEAHGGEISAENNPAAGATITFTLPKE